MEPSRDINRLVEIMKALRDPATGCPWDVEQTFDSIVPYTVEEAYEVADAIERRDAEDLSEELGDLLLQVVYFAQMATEAGLFGFEDVVEGITRKMIRRHPHVFGDDEARSAGSAKGHWERIKAEERAEKAERRRLRIGSTAADRAQMPEDWRHGASPATPMLLDAVPSTFPSLMLSLKLQQRAAKVGFDWTDVRDIRAKIEEEFAEFDAAVSAGDRTDAFEEFGDILFSLVNFGRFHDLDPEMALRACASKFRSRFGYIEEALRRRGRSLQEATLAEMDALWTEAKRPAAQADGPTRTSE